MSFPTSGKRVYTFSVTKKIVENSNHDFEQTGKTITDKPGDNVSWVTNNITKLLPLNNNPTPPDYSKLPHDIYGYHKF